MSGITLPQSYTTRMKMMLGEDYDRYVSSFESRCHHGLRVNTSKISVEEFLKLCPFELKPVPWCSNGFYYDETVQPAKHPYYFAGLYYIQEPSAMTPASVLPVEPGDCVLDLCAAPGGKSTELAAKLNGTGVLVSNDISNSRAKALLKNLELFGIANACVVSEPPNVLANRLEGYFDKILIDAPCSGEGMFRKANSMIKAWEQNGVDYFVGIQRSITKDAWRMLKPGGIMLYSTCTFSPDENEQAIEAMLSEHPDMELLEVPAYEGFDPGHPEWTCNHVKEVTKCKRLWPHRIEGEGHFIAMAKKRDSDKRGGQYPYHKGNGVISKDAISFFESLSYPMNLNQIEVVKERLYLLPDCMPDVKGFRLLRTGLYLGEMKKNRFEPSQALAMALTPSQVEQAISFSAEDERVIRYLKGETIKIDSDESGWILICVDGYPLGWGKANRGVIKNKYLAGWRWQ